MKEESAQLDENGRPLTQPSETKRGRKPKASTKQSRTANPRAKKAANKQETKDVNWQGLTPASNARTGSPQRDVQREMGENIAISDPQRPVYGSNTENRMPVPDVQAPSDRQDSTASERGVDIDRTPRPDARDEEKVDRLAAPDWRSDQPLPSARGAVDPRGENAPKELYKGHENPDRMSES